MSDISSRLAQIVAEHLGVDLDRVVPEASFVDDLGADSLDPIELIMLFEEEFGVEIPNHEEENILTVGDAVSFIQQRM